MGYVESLTDLPLESQEEKKIKNVAEAGFEDIPSPNSSKLTKYIYHNNI